ncbi:MAG: MarR family transcriptional regulator [Roseivirga sp.]|nr:MarR family transcriptional regulator [Roseivirga sp.]
MAKIDSEIKSGFVNDKHRFVTNLVFTANWVQNAFIEDLKPFGLSPQQYNILRILRSVGDWTRMSEVKDGLTEKSPNTTRLADKLINKDLIERKASETDRRVVYVRISKKGETLFDEINQRESVIQKALDNNISAKNAGYLSDILDKFRG